MSLDESAPLAISRHADLKSRAGRDVLVLPERAILIGGSGAEILGLVSHGRSSRAIVEAMSARYPDSPEVTPRVLAFLREMLDLGGIVRVDGDRVDGPVESTS